MKRYTTYKNSGIDYLGEIPNHWNIIRARFIFDVISGNGFPDELQGRQEGEVPFYKCSDINNPAVYIKQANNYVSLSDVKINKWSIIPCHSIIMAKIGESLKKNHRKINNSECLVDNNMMAIALKNESVIRLKYYYYLMCLIRMEWFVNPGAVPSVDVSKFRSFSVPSFGKDEQRQIKTYLDRKTAQIDALIAKKQRMIELLKEERAAVINQAVTKGLDPSVEMKDSGVDWLGEVPSRWKAGKIRFAFVTVSGNGFPDDLQGRSEGDMPFYKVSDINSSDLYMEAANNYVSFSDIQTNRWNVIPEGSIVLAKIGAALAKNHRKITNTDCLIDNNMMAVTPKDKGHCVKYYYYLMSVIKMEWFSNPGAVPSVDLQRFRSFFIPNVPPEEQKAIASFLDQKTAQIDGQISREERSIELLKEYRTVLISEAVTGKIDVRN